MILWSIVIGFVLGTLLRSFFVVEISMLGMGALIGGAILLYSLRASSKLPILVALSIFSGLLGIIRYDFAERSLPQEYLAEMSGEAVVIEGVLVDRPDVRDDNTKLTISIPHRERESAPLRVLVTTERYPEFSYGDRVRVEGIIETPEPFFSDEVRTFNYPQFLAKDGIVAVMVYPDITLIREGEGYRLFDFLYTIRESFLSRINLHIAEPASGLLAGLLLGSKQSLGEELKEIFQIAGVTHIVVLSGYNVTIVAEAIMRLLAFLPLTIAASLGGVAMILFALISGLSATVVRATLMALLILFARVTNRTSDTLRLLLLVGMGMIIHNPLILAFDPSFQLSFIATLGLIVGAPPIEKRLTFLPERFGLRSIGAATIATQIAVLPLLLWMTGVLSLVALPANLLVLWSIPGAMLLGAITGVLGYLSWWLAFPFALGTELILRYELLVITLLAKIPFASLSIPAFPFWVVILLYGAMGVVYKKYREPTSLPRSVLRSSQS